MPRAGSLSCFPMASILPPFEGCIAGWIITVIAVTGIGAGAIKARGTGVMTQETMAAHTIAVRTGGVATGGEITTAGATIVTGPIGAGIPNGRDPVSTMRFRHRT